MSSQKRRPAILSAAYCVGEFNHVYMLITRLNDLQMFVPQFQSYVHRLMSFVLL